MCLIVSDNVSSLSWHFVWCFGYSDKAERVLDIAEEVAEVVEDVAEAVEKAASEVSDNLPGAGMLKDAAEWVEGASEDLAEGARLATNIIRKVNLSH